MTLRDTMYLKKKQQKKTSKYQAKFFIASFYIEVFSFYTLGFGNAATVWGSSMMRLSLGD